MDYSIYDAHLAGFDRVVFVIRPELESAIHERTDRLRGRMRTGYVIQPLDESSSRTKPWGTGHAVLAAQDQVDGPFVVINADDSYGRESYATLARHLEARPAGNPVFSLVGFRLNETLSAHGGVSRGVCRSDNDGFLSSIREVVDLKREGDQISGTYPDGTSGSFSGAETVSMNIWGFTPAVFEMLRSRFTAFLSDHAGDAQAEFRIPDAVNDMVATGDAQIEILPAKESFFGITHPDDRAHAQNRIHALVAQGQYPARLFGTSSDDC
jgi:dTDP-glucose pyrophosphorylase